MKPTEQYFLDLALANPTIPIVLERTGALELTDWYLTGGSVFQAVWNGLSGRDPQAGINDYDLFYFDDSDLSYQAEDAVIRRSA